MSANLTTLFLRIASAISLLFTLGHTMGGMKRWSPMGENEVLRQMTDVHFDTMGVSRSYLDFFMGFGWSLSAAMFMQTVLLWQLAAQARTNVVSVRPMIAVFALNTLVGGIISWRFLFPVPAMFSGILFLALVAAYAVARCSAAYCFSHLWPRTPWRASSRTGSAVLRASRPFDRTTHCSSADLENSVAQSPTRYRARQHHRSDHG